MEDLMRKHAVLFAATLLCARKRIETRESDKPNMAKQYFIDRAINVTAVLLGNGFSAGSGGSLGGVQDVLREMRSVGLLEAWGTTLAHH
jgi:hypothetical protein